MVRAVQRLKCGSQHIYANPGGLMLERSRGRTQSPGDCVERARALAPMIVAAASSIEQEGAIAPHIIAAMHDARLFRLLIPRAYGGEELQPVWYVQAVEEIVKADAS